MAVCGKCSESFCDHQSIKGIVLTRVCETCIVSTELLTKASAISLGARPDDLDNLGHLRESNRTYLFLEDEVKHVAGIANTARAEKEGARRSKDQIKTQIKRVRQEGRDKCREKRIRNALSQIKTTAPPTPGLVSGDFCTSATKTPRMSVAKLSKRANLWRCLDFGNSLSHKVNLFRFACDRGLYACSRDHIESSFQSLHQSLDRVVLIEGHRILHFLTPEERLHASRAVESTEQELYELPVHVMSDGMYSLCEHTKKRLKEMRVTHPATRKRIFGKTTKASWHDVHAMLVCKRGQVIPDRIEYYGASRVFDMICKEAGWGRKANVSESFARFGIHSPPQRFLETLERKYIKSNRLMDFQIVEHIIRVFCDSKMVGVDVPRRFDLLLRKMEQMVYHEGTTWGEAADEAARSITAADAIAPVVPGYCACGNQSAKRCVSAKCGECCDDAVACPRHKKW